MHTTPIPNKTELRQFGLVLALILAIIFGAVPLWWIGKPPILSMMGVVAVLLVWSLLIPHTLKNIYRVWMFVGEILGWVNTRLILGILYVIMFIPTALLIKLFGRDPMRRKYDAKASSYRNPSRILSPEQIERPY